MDVRSSLKVLIVSDAYYPYLCGLSEYVHHLACKLRVMGHHVDIAAGSFGTKDERKYAVERIGRSVFVPLNKSFAVVPVGFDVPVKMRLLVERSGYEVLHLNGPIFPNLSYFALKYSVARNVATFHTASEKVQGIGSPLFKLIFGNTYKKIDVKIAVSEDAIRTNEIYIPGKYHVVPPGVETNIFTPRGQKDTSLSGNTVLFVGRMDPRKGQHRLLDAFPLVKKKISDARLVVVGHGPLYGKYINMVGKANIAHCVSFEGVQHIGEPLAKYFRSAAVYTSPAVGRESFGIVLIEAMASGTPVVASKIAGYNRVIENGRNGLMVDTSDAPAYADAIVRLMKDKSMRRKIIAEGLRDVETKYSWDIIAGRIEQLYYA